MRLYTVKSQERTQGTKKSRASIEERRDQLDSIGERARTCVDHSICSSTQLADDAFRAIPANHGVSAHSDTTRATTKPRPLAIGFGSLRVWGR